MIAFGGLYVLVVGVLALLSALGVVAVPGLVLALLAAPLVLGVVTIFLFWTMALFVAGSIARDEARHARSRSGSRVR